MRKPCFIPLNPLDVAVLFCILQCPASPAMDQDPVALGTVQTQSRYLGDLAVPLKFATECNEEQGHGANPA